MAEGGTLDIAIDRGVLANDTDGGSIPLTANVVAAPAHAASFELRADGSFVYIHDGGESRFDTFDYTAYDGIKTSKSKRVVITVDPVNDAPAITGQTNPLNMPEDTSLDVTSKLNVADPDNSYPQGFTVLLTPGPNYTVDGGKIDPEANYYGPLTVPVVINDGLADSAPYELTVNVTPVNDSPIITGQSPVSALINMPREIDFGALSVTDVDNHYPDNFTLTVKNGSNYTVNGTTITPKANFIGDLTVPVSVSDGAANSNTFNLKVEVLTPTGRPMILGQESLETLEDTPLTIRLTDLIVVDPDFNPADLVVSVHAGSNYAVSGTSTIIPASNYNGQLTVPVTVSDGTGGASDPFNLKVTVTPVNDNPVAVNDTANTAEDTPLVIAADVLLDNDSDIDRNTLNVTSVQSAVNGTVNLAAGNITFTPTANYNGSASFTYTIDDSDGGTATGTVNVTVTSVNDSPVANNDTATTAEDTPLVIEASVLLANDADVDINTTLSIASVQDAVNGAVSLSGTTITFTPAANYNGAASFTYTVSDGNVGGTDTGVVNVTVTPVNDPPVATDDSVTTTEDTPLAIAVDTLLTNDTDVDINTTLSIASVQDAVNGAVSLSGTTITFTPAANYNGAASFTYTVSDGNIGGTDIGAVTVTVTAANDTPVISSAPVTAATQDALYQYDVQASDVDTGDTLTYALTTFPTGMSINPTTGLITWTPGNGDVGLSPHNVTVRVADNGLPSLSVSQSFTVTVANVNDAPVAGDNTAIIAEDTPLVIAASVLLANDTDADGDTLSVTAVGGAVNGAVSLSGTTITFTPASNYNGAASFTYTVSDGNGGTDTGTVNVTVTPVNDPPVANNDTATTAEDTPLVIAASTLTSDDTDVDVGDTLSITSVGSAVNGTVSLASGNVTFAPASNYNGPASFGYTISDGHGGTDTATVNVTVTTTNDPPVANSDSNSVTEDAGTNAVSGNVRTNDTDTEDATSSLTVTHVNNVGTPVNLTATYGSLTLNSTGAYTYTLNNADLDTNALSAGQIVTEVFSYTLRDTGGATATGTLTITITGANDAPVANTACGTTPQANALSGTLTASDVDNSSAQLTYSLSGANGGASKGTVSITNSTTGAFTYTPDGGGPRGRDTFTFRVTDTSGGSDTAVRTVIIDQKIMPLGDDITQGYDSSSSASAWGGYRKPLYDNLAGDGYNIDFVGSDTSGNAISGFDSDNEGHGFMTPSNLASNISDWLDSKPADIILIHTGTYDSDLGTGVSGVDALLNNIDTWAGNHYQVRVLLARIIDDNDAGNVTNIPAFNTAVEGIAGGLSNITVSIVDQQGALTYPSDLADTIHPTAGGYSKMATRWRSALNTAGWLEKCP